MNHDQETKFVAVVPPAAIVDNASFTTASVDTLGWRKAQFVIQLGATDIAMVAAKLQESDDDGVADAYTDVPGADFDGDTNIDGAAATLPSGTDDNKFFVIEVDLRGRQRYLDLVLTAGDGAAGSYLSALCILSRGEESPTTMAERGADQVLRV